MDPNFRDGSSYLDGIPVKISKQFWPPKPVTIPQAIDTKTPPELLSVQYDFSLERSIIEYSQKRQLEIAEAKLKPSQKATTNSIANAGESSQKSSAQRVLPWQPDTILQPQQSAEKTESNGKDANLKDTTKINLSDFENDTSSPFDYMELQTINDLEELNSVFQGIHTKETTSPETSSATEEDAVSAVAKSVSFPLPQNPWQTTPERVTGSLSGNFASQLPGGSFSKSFLSHPTGQEDPSSTKEDSFPVVTKSVSFPFPQPPLQVTPGRVPGSLSEHFATNVKNSQFFDSSGMALSSSVPKEVKDFFCDKISYSTLSQVPYIPSNAGGSSEKASLRGSKSYTDIRSISDMEVVNLARERSCTPPAFYSESVIEPLPMNEDHFQKPLTESSNGNVHSEDSAYEELDETAKRFVDCIVEMGFAKGQVARAVKHLGMDEKKVVEHLCQIQALEESGYESSEAEAALHLHNYNREQAKEFLDLVIQFQDLGFEKDKVKKALVQNKNDWNKTIDALLP